MAWEHLVLGDLEPGAVSDFAQLEAHCELLAELGRRPLDPDPRLPRAADVIQLPGWHEGALRDLCFGDLFPRWQTRATHLLLTAALPRPAGPPEG